MWTHTNILEHAAALSVKLRDAHWLACGLEHPDASKPDASDDGDVQYMGEEGGDVDEGAGGDGDIEMKTEDMQEDAAAIPAPPVVTPAPDAVLPDTPQTPASEFTCTMVDGKFKITDKEGKLVAHGVPPPSVLARTSATGA